MNEHQDLLLDNKKLVSEFGAKAISDLKEMPDCYTFHTGLLYSHRDFDKFYSALKKGEKCAIVSGFNASGTIHIGHKAVFDTNLYFQKTFGCQVFIPISDDESYITGKAKTQEEALTNALHLAKELLAYGFDPHKTYFIIDQVYTNIYNLAIKLCVKINMSEIKSTYGYKPEDNPGMFFYPTVQSAHILLPQERFGIKHVLVPIGPDEDSHIRICRDIARKAGYNAPAIVHSAFLPGTDGKKMSKSKNNAIYLRDSAADITKKVKKAFSGGAVTAEEQRAKGGDPSKDVSLFYLIKFFLKEEEAKKMTEDYKSGKILSGQLKERLAKELVAFTSHFQERIGKVTDAQVKHCILRNEDVLSGKI